MPDRSNVTNNKYIYHQQLLTEGVWARTHRHTCALNQQYQNHGETPPTSLTRENKANKHRALNGGDSYALKRTCAVKTGVMSYSSNAIELLS